MPKFVREVTEHGSVGAMVRRVLRLGVGRALKLAWWNKSRVLAIVKKDFGAGMVLLLQLELLELSRRVKQVAITDQVVDLAVACGNYRLLEGLVQAVRVAGREPVIVTNNLPQALQALARAKVEGVSWAFAQDELEEKEYLFLLEPERVYPYELLA